MFKKIIAALAALLAATAFAAVDANKATQAELESIKGIGPSISAKIVDERKKGNYKDWNDLVTRVNGIGDTNAATLSTGGLTVDGKAYAGALAAATTAPAASKPSTTAKITGARQERCRQRRLGRQVGRPRRCRKHSRAEEGVRRKPGRVEEDLRHQEIEGSRRERAGDEVGPAPPNRPRHRAASRSRGLFYARTAAAGTSLQSKNARTSGTRASVSRMPSVISSRVYGASNNR